MDMREASGPEVAGEERIKRALTEIGLLADQLSGVYSQQGIRFTVPDEAAMLIAARAYAVLEAMWGIRVDQDS